MTLITDGGKKLEQLKAAWHEQVAQDDQEQLKAACRDIFYESMRQQINAVNQSRPVALRTADLRDLDHLSVLEVVWPTFR